MMSQESNISSKNKSTVPVDVIVGNTVRKVRRTTSKNLHNIDKEKGRRERIAIAAYYRAEKREFKSGEEEQDWLEAEATVDKHHNIAD
jgi:DUF2934 family protein